jgi:2-methylisocitrate lyase-like PEP mutase family enzyme
MTLGRATTVDQVRASFRRLHERGTFVLPNPWDVGSARLLQALGFHALATTSSGFAASLGRLDQHVTRDELVTHVAALTSAVDVPVNVDAERCYADDPGGVAATVELLAAAGASGVSIEDYDPRAGRIDDVGTAIERVAEAAAGCDRYGLVLTARCENHLYGVDDLDDTIARLRAYREAGAGAVYAPGLTTVDEAARVVAAVDAPVNVLAVRGGPAVPQLAAVGVRRVSTGGSLARAAYGALVDAARELLSGGTSSYLARALSADLCATAFDGVRRA